MRIIIDKHMREMCGNVPVWIPDGELESCYDEYCHQVSPSVYVMTSEVCYILHEFYGLVSTT
ncbi:hypothetical protein EDD16DRAFT_1623888, partial [Pisolithus croceorrhizus]